MTRAARLTATAAVALLAASLSSPAYAAVLRTDFQPHAVTGATIREGADGAEHTLMCPPDENVLSGGYTVSAPTGRELDGAPGDVLTDRPTTDATGWIVAVRKSLRAHHDGLREPAELTLQVVCTEGESGPGA